MTTWTNIIALLARILLAFLFVQGGYNKLFGGMAGTVANMTSHGSSPSWHSAPGPTASMPSAGGEANA